MRKQSNGKYIKSQFDMIKPLKHYNLLSMIQNLFVPNLNLGGDVYRGVHAC